MRRITFTEEELKNLQYLLESYYTTNPCKQQGIDMLKERINNPSKFRNIAWSAQENRCYITCVKIGENLLKIEHIGLDHYTLNFIPYTKETKWTLGSFKTAKEAEGIMIDIAQLLDV